MDKAFKSIMKGLEKPIKEYAQELDGGKHEMTEKDPQRMFYLMGAMAMGKLLCMLEEMKGEGEKKGQNTMSGMMDMMGKVGSMFPQMRQSGNMTHIGFEGNDGWQNPSGNYNRHPIMPMEDRRGVPGTGRRGNRNEIDDTYDHHEDDMEPEDRRRRSSRTGRFVRGENENDMNDRMENDTDNRQGNTSTRR